MPIHSVFCNGEAERLTLAKPLGDHADTAGEANAPRASGPFGMHSWVSHFVIHLQGLPQSLRSFALALQTLA